VSAADVAWSLLQTGSGHHDAAAELALGLVGDPTTSADDVAKAGTILLTMHRYRDAVTARDRAVADGAAPILLAYLDTSCRLVVDRDDRAAREALGRHLADVPGPLHHELPDLAADTGAPVLAWRASGRAGLGVRRRVTVTARAALRRTPARSAASGLRGPML
jgi:hypothetical protein